MSILQSKTNATVRRAPDERGSSGSPAPAIRVYDQTSVGPVLAKVYEIDPLVCPKCGWEMKAIAMIQDPVEIRDILAHLVKTGRAPPGFDPAALN